MALCAACSTSVPDQPYEKPHLSAVAYELPPVGNVEPVFIAIECQGQCDRRPYVARADVQAIRGSEQPIPALPLAEAVSKAGGAVALSPLVTSTPDSEVTSKLIRRSARPLPPSNVTPFAPFVLAALAYSGYLYANPEAMQAEKLASVVIAEGPPSGLPPFRGWVFFPKANYSKVVLNIKDRSEYKQIERLEVPVTAISAQAGEGEGWLEHGVLPSGMWPKYGAVPPGGPK